jgi:general secretion pathway protein J
VTRRDAGFTLLEILVALVVFGVLLLTLSQGTRFGLLAFDRQNEAAERGGRLDAVDRTLRRLIEQADPGNTVDGNTLAGGRHAMAFRAPLVEGPEASLDPEPDEGTEPHRADAPPPPGMANLRLAVDGQHRLVLFFLPYRHAVSLQPPQPPHALVLMTGVRDIEMSYFASGKWQRSWTEAVLPALVRVRILFTDENRRWPDIVAAPLRQQLG